MTRERSLTRLNTASTMMTAVVTAARGRRTHGRFTTASDTAGSHWHCESFSGNMRCGTQREKSRNRSVICRQDWSLSERNVRCWPLTQKAKPQKAAARRMQVMASVTLPLTKATNIHSSIHGLHLFSPSLRDFMALYLGIVRNTYVCFCTKW